MSGLPAAGFDQISSALMQGPPGTRDSKANARSEGGKSPFNAIMEQLNSKGSVPLSGAVSAEGSSSTPLPPTLAQNLPVLANFTGPADVSIPATTALADGAIQIDPSAQFPANDGLGKILQKPFDAINGNSTFKAIAGSDGLPSAEMSARQQKGQSVFALSRTIARPGSTEISQRGINAQIEQSDPYSAISAGNRNLSGSAQAKTVINPQGSAARSDMQSLKNTSEKSISRTEQVSASGLVGKIAATSSPLLSNSDVLIKTEKTNQSSFTATPNRTKQKDGASPSSNSANAAAAQLQIAALPIGNLAASDGKDTGASAPQSDMTDNSSLAVTASMSGELGGQSEIAHVQPHVVDNHLQDIKAISVETHMLPVASPPPALQIANAIITDLNASVATDTGTSVQTPATGQIDTSQPMRVLQLALEPPGLGQVMVQIRMTDGKLALELRSSGHETLRIIEADKDKLVTSLTNAGYSLDKLVMDIAPNQTGSPESQNGSATQFGQSGSTGNNTSSGGSNRDTGDGNPFQGGHGTRNGIDAQTDRNNANGTRDLFL